MAATLKAKMTVSVVQNTHTVPTREKKKNFHTAAPGDSRGRHHGELVHERPCVVEEVELLERA